MKKLILCTMTALIYAGPFSKADADESRLRLHMNEASNQIAAVYNAIDFSDGSKPAFDVFEKAYTGYINLLNAGKLNAEKQVITICDMSLSSNTNRMWIVDLAAKKVLLNNYVAHGQGSGDEYATAFSNTNNSHQSSIGMYVTGDTYIGEHGRSLYLHGMDNGFNHNAYKRSIVVHGANYVSKDFIAQHKRLGRSWGCPAVSDKLSNKVIDMIKDGTVLFIYYPQAKYMRTAYWINKKIDRMPSNLDEPFQPVMALNAKGPVKVVYEYGPLTKSISEAVSRIQFPLY